MNKWDTTVVEPVNRCPVCRSKAVERHEREIGCAWWLCRDCSFVWEEVATIECGNVVSVVEVQG